MASMLSLRSLRCIRESQCGVAGRGGVNLYWAHRWIGGSAELLHKERYALLCCRLVHKAKLAEGHPRMCLHPTHTVSSSFLSCNTYASTKLNNSERWHCPY